MVFSSWKMQGGRAASALGLSLALVLPAAAQEQPVCPSEVAPHEPGLTQPYSLPLRRVVAVAASQADVVFLGETVHSDDSARRFLSAPETISVLAGMGIKGIFVEDPQNTQKPIDRLRAGRTPAAQSLPAFGDGFLEELSRHGIMPTSKVIKRVKWLFGLIRDAQSAGISVIAADPQNGYDESTAMASLQYRFNKGEVSEEEVGEVYKAFQRARFDDRTLATYIDEVLDRMPEGKGLLLYGSAHGSRYGDFEEHMKRRVLRIDVYPSRLAMMENIVEAKESNETGIGGAGEDKPDLVYIMDEGLAYATCATTEQFAQAINTAVPAEKPALESPGIR